MALDAIGLMEAMEQRAKEQMTAPFQFYNIRNTCGHDTVEPIWDGLATHPMPTAADGFRVRGGPCFDCAARKLFAADGMSPGAIDAALANIKRNSQRRGHCLPERVE